MPEPGTSGCARGETREHATLPGSHSGHAPAQVSVLLCPLTSWPWGPRHPEPGVGPAHPQLQPGAGAPQLAGQVLSSPGAGPQPPGEDSEALPVHSLTSPEASASVLAAVTQTLTQYPFDFRGARILSGQDEGVFGWVTANYLLENFIKVGPAASPMSRGCGHPPTD